MAITSSYHIGIRAQDRTHAIGVKAVCFAQARQTAVQQQLSQLRLHSCLYPPLDPLPDPLPGPLRTATLRNSLGARTGNCFETASICMMCLFSGILLDQIVKAALRSDLVHLYHIVVLTVKIFAKGRTRYIQSNESSCQAVLFVADRAKGRERCSLQ